MSTSAATHASSIKRRLERLERIRTIKEEGLLYSNDVMQRFGVSNPTAVADLRSAYGELPTKPRQVRPAPVKRAASDVWHNGIHFNLRMSERTYEILTTGAAVLGLGTSEAIRYAIISTFATEQEQH